MSISLEDLVCPLRNRLGYLVDPIHQTLDRSNCDRLFLNVRWTDFSAMIISSLSLRVISAGSGGSATQARSCVWLSEQETNGNQRCKHRFAEKHRKSAVIEVTDGRDFWTLENRPGRDQNCLREIFSFCMREFKVVRFIPRRSAAPPGPPILPLASRSTRMMCSRSTSSRAEEVDGWTFSAGAGSNAGTLQERAAGENDRALDDMLQFANIARPGILAQRLHPLR